MELSDNKNNNAVFGGKKTSKNITHCEQPMAAHNDDSVSTHNNTLRE